MKMATCRECGMHHEEGALFCSECGSTLLVARNLTVDFMTASNDITQTLPPNLISQVKENVVPSNQLLFVIPSSGRRITLEMDREIRVGRADPRRSVQPALDLNPDKGGELGVSRVHASVQSTNRGLVLVDLGSKNGTLLNNHRLPPDLPYPLHDGDEIRFGRLLVHVFFDS